MKHTSNGFKSDDLVLDQNDMKLLFGGHTLSESGIKVSLDCGSIEKAGGPMTKHEYHDELSFLYGLAKDSKDVSLALCILKERSLDGCGN